MGTAKSSAHGAAAAANRRSSSDTTHRVLSEFRRGESLIRSVPIADYLRLIHVDHLGEEREPVIDAGLGQDVFPEFLVWTDRLEN